MIVMVVMSDLDLTLHQQRQGRNQFDAPVVNVSQHAPRGSTTKPKQKRVDQGERRSIGSDFGKRHHEKQAAKQTAPESAALIAGEDSFEKLRERKGRTKFQPFPFFTQKSGTLEEFVPKNGEDLPVDENRRQPDRRNHKKRKLKHGLMNY